MSRWIAAPLCVLALSALAISSSFAHESPCKDSSPSDAVVTASKDLEENPEDLKARLRLADAQMADHCFEGAVETLEEGEAVHGRNAELQSELREARSMLREQGYFEGLDRAEEAAKLSRHLLRCNRFADIEACDQAIALKPDDPQIVIAKADALLQARRPAEALQAYSRVRKLAPGTADIEQKIAAAEAQRHEDKSRCMSGTGRAALQSCQGALIVDADDEFDILKRTATLLQAANQPSAALDSYIAAHWLRQGDRSVALAIVSVGESARRTDAMTLAARGSSLLTLGRAIDALTPLKQSLALAPDLPGVKVRLARAEQQAADEARKIMQASRLAQQKQNKRAVAAVTKSEVAAPLDKTVARRYTNTAPTNQSN